MKQTRLIESQRETQSNNSERDWGRVNLKQQSTGIPNHQNRSFLDTKRENTFCFSWSLIVISWCRDNILWKADVYFLNNSIRFARYAPQSLQRAVHECERSASSSRRLHTCNRACMGQERLSSLALIHIHYQVKIVLDEVVNLFATKHSRRLEVRFILRDWFRSILMYHFTS